jgi:hypothetical protein
MDIPEKIFLVEWKPSPKISKMLMDVAEAKTRPLSVVANPVI